MPTYYSRIYSSKPNTICQDTAQHAASRVCPWQHFLHKSEFQIIMSFKMMSLLTIIVEILETWDKIKLMFEIPNATISLTKHMSLNVILILSAFITEMHDIDSTPYFTNIINILILLIFNEQIIKPPEKSIYPGVYSKHCQVPSFKCIIN